MVQNAYIYAYVKSKGYDDSDKYLIDYINKIAKNNGFNYKEKIIFIKEVYPSDVIIITRYELLKYLLTLDKNKDKNSLIVEDILKAKKI